MQHLSELAAITTATINLTTTLVRLATDALAHRRPRHTGSAPERREES
ncbi:hypothetical protein [Actinomadura sp. DC4]|nr:hypothetical protein [Actinomadura sp. DC4]MDN3357644.1 hypothetical protein [Actinomadura sp. DC4]